MVINTKFVHVNIVAQDWRKLARFYEDVFECVPVPPERDLSGQWLEDATNVAGAKIRGMHLRLPGHGGAGPTLEIFQYTPDKARPNTAANLPGYGHIAFAVDDVETALNAVLAAGGGAVGELVTVDIPNAGTIKFVYAADPEGNIIELQQWAR